ncbi:MAG: DUF3786 domain-containing protein [Syntrophobacterales bacterium]|nr:DUF3786 domain-containing protein [Syntrophobacterales bacterium]
MELRKQKIYKKVFDMACADLVRLDIREKTGDAGVCFSGKDHGVAIEVPFFDEIITVEMPGFSFRSSKSATVSLVMKIVILHYLVRASGIPLADDRISYEDIPGTRSYLPVFEARVTKPLVSAFGYNKDAFLESGLAMGGKREEFGNASFTFYAFPRVPITFILWEGDEEFRPSVKTLFNPSISGYLFLEDISVISRLAAARVIKAARMKYAYEMTE